MLIISLEAASKTPKKNLLDQGGHVCRSLGAQMAKDQMEQRICRWDGAKDMWAGMTLRIVGPSLALKHPYLAVTWGKIW